MAKYDDYLHTILDIQIDPNAENELSNEVKSLSKKISKEAKDIKLNASVEIDEDKLKKLEELRKKLRANYNKITLGTFDDLYNIDEVIKKLDIAQKMFESLRKGSHIGGKDNSVSSKFADSIKPEELNKLLSLYEKLNEADKERKETQKSISNEVNSQISKESSSIEQLHEKIKKLKNIMSMSETSNSDFFKGIAGSAKESREAVDKLVDKLVGSDGLSKLNYANKFKELESTGKSDGIKVMLQDYMKLGAYIDVLLKKNEDFSKQKNKTYDERIQQAANIKNIEKLYSELKEYENKLSKTGLFTKGNFLSDSVLKNAETVIGNYKNVLNGLLNNAFDESNRKYKEIEKEYASTVGKIQENIKTRDKSKVNVGELVKESEEYRSLEEEVGKLKESLEELKYVNESLEQDIKSSNPIVQEYSQSFQKLGNEFIDLEKYAKHAESIIEELNKITSNSKNEQGLFNFSFENEKEIVAYISRLKALGQGGLLKNVDGYEELEKIYARRSGAEHNLIDNISRMTQAQLSELSKLRGSFNGVSSDVSEVGNSAQNTGEQVARANEEMVSGNNNAAKSVGLEAKQFENLISKITGVIQAVNNLSSSFESINKSSESLNDTGEILSSVNEILLKLNESSEKMFGGKKIKGFSEELKKSLSDLKGVLDTIDKSTKSLLTENGLKNILGESESLIKSLKGLPEALDKLPADKIKEIGSSFEKISEVSKELQNNTKSNTISLSEEQSKKLKDTISDIIRSILRLKTSLNGIGENIKDGFKDIDFSPIINDLKSGIEKIGKQDISTEGIKNWESNFVRAINNISEKIGKTTKAQSTSLYEELSALKLMSSKSGKNSYKVSNDFGSYISYKAAKKTDEEKIRKGSSLYFTSNFSSKDGSLIGELGEYLRSGLKRAVISDGNKFMSLDLSSLSKEMRQQIIELYSKQLDSLNEANYKSKYQTFDKNNKAVVDYSKKSEIANKFLMDIIKNVTGQDSSNFLKSYNFDQSKNITKSIQQEENLMSVLKQINQQLKQINQQGLSFDESKINRLVQSISELSAKSKEATQTQDELNKAIEQTEKVSSNVNASNTIDESFNKNFGQGTIEDLQKRIETINASKKELSAVLSFYDEHYGRNIKKKDLKEFKISDIKKEYDLKNLSKDDAISKLEQKRKQILESLARLKREILGYGNTEDGLKLPKNNIETIRSQYDNLFKDFVKINKQIMVLQNRMSETSGSSKLSDGVKELKEETKKSETEQERLGESVKETTTEVEKQAEEFKKSSGLIEETINKTVESINKINESIKEIEDKIKNIPKIELKSNIDEIKESIYPIISNISEEIKGIPNIDLTSSNNNMSGINGILTRVNNSIKKINQIKLEIDLKTIDNLIEEINKIYKLIKEIPKISISTDRRKIGQLSASLSNINKTVNNIKSKKISIKVDNDKVGGLSKRLTNIKKTLNDINGKKIEIDSSNIKEVQERLENLNKTIIKIDSSAIKGVMEELNRLRAKMDNVSKLVIDVNKKDLTGLSTSIKSISNNVEKINKTKIDVDYTQLKEFEEKLNAIIKKIQTDIPAIKIDVGNLTSLENLRKFLDTQLIGNIVSLKSSLQGIYNYSNRLDSIKFDFSSKLDKILTDFNKPDAVENVEKFSSAIKEIRLQLDGFSSEARETLRLVNEFSKEKIKATKDYASKESTDKYNAVISDLRQIKKLQKEIGKTKDSFLISEYNNQIKELEVSYKSILSSIKKTSSAKQEEVKILEKEVESAKLLSKYSMLSSDTEGFEKKASSTKQSDIYKEILELEKELVTATSKEEQSIKETIKSRQEAYDILERVISENETDAENIERINNLEAIRLKYEQEIADLKQKTSYIDRTSPDADQLLLLERVKSSYQSFEEKLKSENVSDNVITQSLKELEKLKSTISSLSIEDGINELNKTLTITRSNISYVLEEGENASEIIEKINKDISEGNYQTKYDSLEENFRKVGVEAEKVELILKSLKDELNILSSPNASIGELLRANKSFNSISDSGNGIIKEGIKKRLEEIESLEDATRRYYELQIKGKDNLSGSEYEKFQKIKEQIEKAKESLREFNQMDLSVFGLEESFTRISNNFTDSLNNGMRDAFKNATSSLLLDFERVKSQFSNKKFVDDITLDFYKLKEYIPKLNDFKITDDAQLPILIERYRELTKELEKFKNSAKDNKNILADGAKINKMVANIEETMRKNTAMSRKLNDEYRQLSENLQKATDDKGNTTVTIAEFEKLRAKLEQLNATLQKSGKTGLSNIDYLAKRAKSMTMNFISFYFSMYDWIRYGRYALETIKSLDEALVDLKKTTTMTSSELNEFYFSANDVAKQMGVTTEEIINQASAWSRLGYSSKEAATQMATLSSQFASISPGMTTDIAQEGLVSLMKSYDIDTDKVKSELMDNINKLGNTFAESNADLVTGMEKSASALAATGTTYQEAFALFTGGMEILQDAESMGTALRTISLRVRGYSEDSEDGLEELDDSLTNISGDLIDLTKTAKNPIGISIYTDDTKNLSESEKKFKSLKDYLGELSDSWDDFNDTQKNNLLQTLFGKTRANAGAAIITNFDSVRGALEAMENSAGSADREMSTIEQSLTYKLNRLKQTWVGTAQDLFDRGDLGDIIDSLNNISKAINNITNALGFFPTAGGVIGFITALKSKSNPVENILNKINIFRANGGFSSIFSSGVAETGYIIESTLVESTSRAMSEVEGEVATGMSEVEATVSSGMAEVEATIVSTSNRLPLELSHSLETANIQNFDRLLLSEQNVERYITLLEGLNSAEARLALTRASSVNHSLTEPRINQIVQTIEAREAEILQEQRLASARENLSRITIRYETVEEQGRTFTVLNEQSVNSLSTALSGLSQQEMLTVLSTQGLTSGQCALIQTTLESATSTGILNEAENALNVVNNELTASTNTISDALAMQVINEKLATTADKEKVLAMYQQIVASNQLNESTLESIASGESEYLTNMLDTESTQQLATSIAELILIKQRAVNAALTEVGSLNAETVAEERLTAAKLAEAEAEKQKLAIKAASNPLKTILNIAISMAVMSIAGKAIQKFSSALTGMSSASEKARDKAEEVKKELDDLNSTYESHSKTVKELAERYDELSKKVANLGKENQSRGTLSTEEYEEFLDISEQLAEAFPEINNGLDENNNVILTLGQNGETAAEGLKKLLEAEKDLANFKASQELDDLYDGVETYMKEAIKAENDYDKNVEILKNTRKKIENGIKLFVEGEEGEEGEEGYLNINFNGDTNAANTYAKGVEKYIDNFYKYLGEERLNALKSSNEYFGQRVTKKDANGNDYYSYDFNGLTVKETDYLNELLGNGVQDGYLEELKKDINDDIEELEQTKKEAENKLSYQWKDFIPSLLSAVQSKASYKELGSDFSEEVQSSLKNLVDDMISGLDWESVYEAINSGQFTDVYDYVQNTILIPLGEIDEETAKSVSSIFSNLENIQINSQSIESAKQQFSDSIDELYEVLKNKNETREDFIIRIGFGDVESTISSAGEQIDSIVKEVSKKVQDVDKEKLEENLRQLTYDQLNEVEKNIDTFINNIDEFVNSRRSDSINYDYYEEKSQKKLDDAKTVYRKYVNFYNKISSKNFDLENKKVSISYSFIGKDENGKETTFTRTTIKNYIKDLLKKANQTIKESGEKWSEKAVYEKVIELDSTLNGGKGIIQSVGDIETLTYVQDKMAESFENLGKAQTQYTAYQNTYKGVIKATIEYTEEAENEITNFASAWASLDKETDDRDSDLSSFKSDVKTLADAGLLTVEKLKAVKGYGSFLNLMGISKDDDKAIKNLVSQINSLSTSADQLASLNKDVSAISDIIGTKEANPTKAISNDDISGLSDDIKECKDEYENFFNVCADGTSTLEEVKEASSLLVTAYMNQGNFLSNLTEENKDAYASVMKLAGISNAEAIVQNKLQVSTLRAKVATGVLAQVKGECTDSTNRLNNATAEEINKILTAEGVTEDLKEAIILAIIEQNILSSGEYVTDSQIQQIQNLISYLYGAAAATAYLNQIQTSSEAGISGGETVSPEKAVKNVVKAYGTQDTSTKVNNQHYVDNNTNKDSGNSGSGDGGSGSDNTTEEKFDWIERKIDYIEKKATKSIDNIEKKLTLKSARKAINYALKQTNQELKVLESAKSAYLKEANNVGLSDEYKRKIQEGSLNIETVTDETLKNNINSYKDYWDKAKDCEDKIQDVKDKQKELNQMKLDKIIEWYDTLEEKAQSIADIGSKNIELKNAEGKIIKASDYNSTIRQDKIKEQRSLKEYKEYKKQYEELVKSGALTGKSKTEALTQLSTLYSDYLDAKITRIEAQDEKSKVSLTKLENSLKLLTNNAEILSYNSELKETKGISLNKKDYTDQIKNSKQQISNYNSQLKILTKLQSKTKKGSEKWYEYNEQINECYSSIRELTKSQYEWNKSISELPLNNIQKVLEKLESIHSVYSSIVSLRETQNRDATNGQVLSQISNNNAEIKQLKKEYEEYLSLKKKANKEGRDDDAKDYEEKANDTLKSIISLESNNEELLDSLYEKYANSIEKFTSSIQKANEQLEKKQKLEKAEYELAKLQSQRTNKVLTENGFVYETDREAIKSAEESLSELKFDALIDALTDLSDELKEYAESSNVNLYDENGKLLSNWKSILSEAINMGNMSVEKVKSIIDSSNISYDNSKLPVIDNSTYDKANDELLSGNDYVVVKKDNSSSSSNLQSSIVSNDVLKEYASSLFANVSNTLDFGKDSVSDLYISNNVLSSIDKAVKSISKNNGNNVTVSIGDIKLNNVNDATSLAESIVRNLPNTLTKALNKK